MARHRAFTYKEKKFNSFGRSELLNYFKRNVSAEDVQDVMWEKRKIDISMSQARRVARHMERRIWEDEKEDTVPFVDMILGLANNYDITNIEALAMVCYIYKAVGEKGDLNRAQVGEIIDKVIPKANELRQENWDKFMLILKEVT